jgi:hypothetical protein
MSDLAMTCVLGEPSKFYWRREELKAWFAYSRISGAAEDDIAEVERKLLAPGELCSTFLQLPLMWEWIGWDWRGLMWEDKYVRSVTSFYGKILKLGNLRLGARKHCEEKSLGDAAHGRLALRALLPTYYRHVYVESSSEVTSYGAYHTTHPSDFSSSHYAGSMSDVCRKVTGRSHQGFDDLMSFNGLELGQLRSMDTLKRDSVKCHSSTPCDYTHCNLCPAGAPCFDPESGLCHSPEGGVCRGRTVMLYHKEKGPNCAQTPLKHTAKQKCRCHKAICWYFTSDFHAALRALGKSEDCKELVGFGDSVVGVSREEAAFLLSKLPSHSRL